MIRHIALAILATSHLAACSVVFQDENKDQNKKNGELNARGKTPLVQAGDLDEPVSDQCYGEPVEDSDLDKGKGQPEPTESPTQNSPSQNENGKSKTPSDVPEDQVEDEEPVDDSLEDDLSDLDEESEDVGEDEAGSC